MKLNLNGTWRWSQPPPVALVCARVVVNGRTGTGVDKAVASLRAGLPHAEVVPLVADTGTAVGCAVTTRTVRTSMSS